MDINIINNELIKEDKIYDLLNFTKDKLGFKKEYLSIVFLDDEVMIAYNNSYRNKNYLTDVLSFVSEEEDEYGDILISISKVKDQSKEYGHSLERELLFLVLHGFLHLNGYDHESEEEEIEMFNLQNEILKELKIER